MGELLSLLQGENKINSRLLTLTGTWSLTKGKVRKHVGQPSLPAFWLVEIEGDVGGCNNSLAWARMDKMFIFLLTELTRYI